VAIGIVAAVGVDGWMDAALALIWTCTAWSVSKVGSACVVPNAVNNGKEKLAVMAVFVVVTIFC
jgi:hypothetical protein